MERLFLKEESSFELHPAIKTLLVKNSLISKRRGFKNGSVSENENETTISSDITDEKDRRKSNLSIKSGSTSGLLGCYKSNSYLNKLRPRSGSRRMSIYISSNEIVQAKLDFNKDALEGLLSRKRTNQNINIDDDSIEN